MDGPLWGQTDMWPHQIPENEQMNTFLKINILIKTFSNLFKPLWHMHIWYLTILTF